MSNYKGLFTFDTDGHKYVTVGAADGIITDIDCEPSELTEALIKDEKIRKAVRAWAEANDVEEADYWNSDYRFQDAQGGSSISFENNPIETKNRYGNDVYTIAELCGEEEE